MTDEKKAGNITCFECGADIAAEEVAEAGGRCVKCGYNIQLHRDQERIELVRKKEAEKTDKEEKPISKKRKLYGFGG